MKKVYLIAVIFALIAGFATYMFAKQIDAKTTIQDAETVNVVVAVQDIAKNTKITEEMLTDEENPYFTTKTVLAEDAAPNYLTDMNELLDLVTIDPLYTGEQVNTARLQTTDGEDVALSFQLTNGYVAYTFSASSSTGVDGYVSVGDTVDVVVYEVDEEDPDDSEAVVAYSDLKIIRVSTNTANASSESSGSKITEYSTLTVEVTPENALKLYEIENEYNYKLVLNPRT